MAIYAIGDIQGCFAALQKLLDQIRFDPSRDRLWFVGDLVNRGPDSVSVLRYVKKQGRASLLRFLKRLGRAAVTVLGNHDLHLLAVANGCRPARPKDTFHDVLDAPDRDELLAWLRNQPLLYRENNFLLVHAGLLPQWTVCEAETFARDAEKALRSTKYRAFLRSLYQDEPGRWSEKLTGMDRLSVVTKVLTRIRVCTETGKVDWTFTGTPDQAPDGYLPWFQVPSRRSAETTIICGHWAAMGLRVHDNLLALDGGCVWGRQLVAVRLEDRQVFHVSCDGRLGAAVP
ncbi:MAG: symmetrical bis(5'-nucleosyl)-tetraphosphatase [Nitrospiraceae bacterium]